MMILPSQLLIGRKVVSSVLFLLVAIFAGGTAGAFVAFSMPRGSGIVSHAFLSKANAERSIGLGGGGLAKSRLLPAATESLSSSAKDTTDEVTLTCLPCSTRTFKSRSAVPVATQGEKSRDPAFIASATDAVDAFARSRLRASTSQCDRVYFDVIADAVVHRRVRPEECPGGLLAAVARGAKRPPLPHGMRGEPGLRYFAPLELPGCRLRWFTPDEACELIASTGNLILVGDSTMRGIALGLHTIMTNNYRYGGIYSPLPHQDSVWSQCECDGMWSGAHSAFST